MSAAGFVISIFGAFLIGAGVERALSSFPAVLPAWFYIGFGTGAFMTGFALVGKAGAFSQGL